MAMSDSVRRSFFTSTIFVGRFAGSCEDFQNKIFNISMLHFNFYPLGSGRPGLLLRHRNGARPTASSCCRAMSIRKKGQPKLSAGKKARILAFAVRPSANNGDYDRRAATKCQHPHCQAPTSGDISAVFISCRHGVVFQPVEGQKHSSNLWRRLCRKNLRQFRAVCYRTTSEKAVVGLVGPDVQ